MKKEKVAPKKNIMESVKMILKKYPKTRNSDKLLQAYYWDEVDQIFMVGTMFMEDFISRATSAESIRRARQLIQAEARRNIEETGSLKENLCFLASEDTFIQRRYLEQNARESKGGSVVDA